MAYIVFTLGVVCLICIAGFIAGAETAITGASKAHLYHLAKKKDRRAEKVIKLKDEMTTSIGTILVLNQMVVYLIPIVSTLFALKYFSTAETAIMQTIIAILLMTYAEIFPKMVAIKFTMEYALFVAPFVNVIVYCLKPLVSILEYCARISVKLLRMDVKDDHMSENSDEELRGAIEMHSSEGDEDEEQKKIMLKSILDLEDIRVTQAMVHRKNMSAIDLSLPIEKIADELINCQFSRVPVWKDSPENIVGILKTKTFFRAMQLSDGNIGNIKVNDLITPPWFIPETTHLLEQLQNFRKKREHFAIVVDEYGDLMGCITLEDILEEIVGDIGDEYDESVNQEIVTQSDGSVIVYGTTPIRDINRELDWNIPEENTATIAGYIMDELRKIPGAGQVYNLSGYKMEILRRQRNQIVLIKITPIAVSEKKF